MWITKLVITSSVCTKGDIEGMPYILVVRKLGAVAAILLYTLPLMMWLFRSAALLVVDRVENAIQQRAPFCRLIKKSRIRNRAQSPVCTFAWILERKQVSVSSNKKVSAQQPAGRLRVALTIQMPPQLSGKSCFYWQPFQMGDVWTTHIYTLHCDAKFRKWECNGLVPRIAVGFSLENTTPPKVFTTMALWNIICDGHHSCCFRWEWKWIRPLAWVKMSFDCRDVCCVVLLCGGCHNLVLISSWQIIEHWSTF